MTTAGLGLEPPTGPTTTDPWKGHHDNRPRHLTDQIRPPTRPSPAPAAAATGWRPRSRSGRDPRAGWAGGLVLVPSGHEQRRPAWLRQPAEDPAAARAASGRRRPQGLRPAPPAGNLRTPAWQADPDLGRQRRLPRTD